jgi:hypothetical protein
MEKALKADMATAGEAATSLSPFFGKFSDASEVTVLLVGANGRAMTNLALSIYREVRKVRMVSELPLDDDPGRPQVDFVVFVVRAHAVASLDAVRRSLPHLGAEYLHGRCCLALCRDDPEAPDAHATPSSLPAREASTPEEEAPPAHKKAKAGPQDQGAKATALSAAATRGSEISAAPAALAFAAQWNLPVVQGSVLTVAACKGLAASIAGLSRSPSGCMLLSCVV